MTGGGPGPDAETLLAHRRSLTGASRTSPARRAEGGALGRDQSANTRPIAKATVPPRYFRSGNARYAVNATNIAFVTEINRSVTPLYQLY